MDFGVATVVAITVICYAVGEVIKSTKLDNKYIPAIMLMLGAVLGAVGMYVMPEYPANDIITAVAVGFASGGASTGVNQTIKQLANKEE